MTLLFSCPTLAASSSDSFFDACDVQGSTTLYDLKEKRWIKTDSSDSERRTLPASTFKIVNSLIALQEGVTSTTEIFKWDGISRSREEWNQDLNLRDAFKYSAVWVYEILAKRISDDVYLQYFNRIPYGNGDITHGKNGNFWVYGSFGVTPAEQIDMLIKLYKNKLPFSQSVMDTVKGFMFSPNEPLQKTYGKSGWTEQNGQQIGWWVGYTEYPGKPIFFATRITKPTNKPLGDFIECRRSITEKIIKDYVHTKG